MPRKIEASQARKSNLNMRTTADMRARLEAAAASSGRALSHEIEHRLEMSFERQSVAEQIREFVMDCTVSTSGGHLMLDVDSPAEMYERNFRARSQ